MDSLSLFLLLQYQGALSNRIHSKFKSTVFTGEDPDLDPANFFLPDPAPTYNNGYIINVPSWAICTTRNSYCIVKCLQKTLGTYNLLHS